MTITSCKTLLLTQAEWDEFDMLKLKKMMIDGEIVSWKIIDFEETEPYTFG